MGWPPLWPGVSGPGRFSGISGVPTSGVAACSCASSNLPRESQLPFISGNSPLYLNVSAAGFEFSKLNFRFDIVHGYPCN